ncbi:RNA polymerase subunit sigma-24 [Gorillibacterium sp. sgz500922]|uniref:RNA polymerase subunit sigma-24 n=1 Tax=Gorillibacterium sp. sgz500922 TaxID=3446694 RepID=UPI003F661B7E
MTEQDVIEKLQDYKRIVGRIRVLERHHVGMGYTVKAITQDDQLQELHRQLRGLPSYMYLTAREQELETTANAYLSRYPAGIRSQYREVAGLHSEDAEDGQRLQELTGKIRKVLEARIGAIPEDAIEALLARMCELQELEAERAYIDTALDVLEEMHPGYGRLLRLRYVEDKLPDEVAEELKVVRRTFERRRPKALEEYGRLTGMS